MKAPQIALDLLKARAVIESLGWTKGTRQRGGPDGPCCARGALWVAVTGKAWSPTVTTEEQRVRVYVAEELLATVVGHQYVTTYNDNFAHGEQEILSAFDAAASLALSEAAARS